MNDHGRVAIATDPDRAQDEHIMTEPTCAICLEQKDVMNRTTFVDPGTGAKSGGRVCEECDDEHEAIPIE